MSESCPIIDPSDRMSPALRSLSVFLNYIFLLFHIYITSSVLWFYHHLQIYKFFLVLFIVILNGNQLKSCPGLQSKLQLSYLRIVIPSCGWSAKAAGHQLLTVGRREQESRDSLSSHISCWTLLLDLLVRSMGPRIRYVCETQII